MIALIRYEQLVLAVGMAGAVLITMAAIARHWARWNTEMDDPLTTAKSLGGISMTGWLLVVWAALVAPCVGSW